MEEYQSGINQTSQSGVIILRHIADKGYEQVTYLSRIRTLTNLVPARLIDDRSNAVGFCPTKRSLLLRLLSPLAFVYGALVNAILYSS